MSAAVVPNLALSPRSRSYLPDLTAVSTPRHEHLTKPQEAGSQSVRATRARLSQLSELMANLGSMPSALPALETHERR